MSSVRQNINYHRMEAADSRARMEERRTQRAAELRAEKEQQRREMADAKREALENAKRVADKVRSSSPKKKAGGAKGKAKSARAPREQMGIADCAGEANGARRRRHVNRYRSHLHAMRRLV